MTSRPNQPNRPNHQASHSANRSGLPITATSAGRIVLAFATVFVVLTAWGAFAPSHINWGVSAIGFYGTPVRLLALLLAASLLLNPVLKVVEETTNRLAVSAGSMRTRLYLAATLALNVVLWFLFQPKLHLLGDGAILLRSIPNYAATPGIPESFRNQPLLWLIFRAVESVLSIGMNPDPHDVYVAIDLLGGILLFVLIVWFLKTRKVPAGEKILIGLLLFAGGGGQFFFGYIENYVLQYVATMAYVLTGWLVLEKKMRVWIPVLLFVVLVGLHIGDLVYAPSVLYLAAADRGMNFVANRIKILAAALIAVVASVALLLAIGMNVSGFIMHFINGSPDFLPVLPGNGDYYPYSLFSPWHFLDWGNAVIHTAPFALIMVVAGAFTVRQEPLRKQSGFLFILIAALGGWFFAWVVNSALGQARDWDLMASFFVPLMILGVYALLTANDLKGRPSIFAATALLSVLHLALGVGVNADPEKHLARVETLGDPRLLAVSSRLFQEEALANFFFDDGQYNRARVYYEQYNASGTLNPRVIANLSDCYRKLEMKEQYFATLKRAAQINSPNPGVYSNLAVEFVTRGDTTMAIAMNLKCIGMDSTQNQAYANLAVVYLNVGKFDSCIIHSNLAIRFGFNDPIIYRIIGKASLKLARYEDAVHAYDRYLAASPGDRAIREQRDRLAVLIGMPAKPAGSGSRPSNTQ